MRDAMMFVLYACAIAMGCVMGGFLGGFQAGVVGAFATVRAAMLLARSMEKREAARRAPR